MKRSGILKATLAALLCASPCFAQNPFENHPDPRVREAFPEFNRHDRMQQYPRAAIAKTLLAMRKAIRTSIRWHRDGGDGVTPRIPALLRGTETEALVKKLGEIEINARDFPAVGEPAARD